MTQQHPITPPSELMQQWVKRYEDGANLQSLFYSIFQAGADQELEACCEWLEQQTLCGHQDLLPSFRADRRPKPPSLKKQALEDLDSLIADLANHGMGFKATNIRRALEALPD